VKEVLGLAAMDFACYCLAMRTDYALAPHHRKLIDHLEAVERGEITRLVIAMPPQHGKSLTGSILFPAWMFGRHPERNTIFVTYAQEPLADEIGTKVRELLRDQRHRAIFPACRLVDGSAAASRFSTTAGGSYLAVGRGAGITGRGAHLLLIDDPLKDNREAASATTRRELQEWYAWTARTRLRPGGAIIVIATRWHEDDLTGWLLRENASEGWRVLSMPAIAEQDEDFRREGEALWPERYPLEALQQLRSLRGGAAFTSLYQCRPAAAEGRIFKREWWGTFREAPAFDRIVIALDTAFKATTESDYSAAVTIGETRTGFYVLGAWRGKVEFPELKRRVVELAQEYKPAAIVIEDRASGQSLLQEFQRETNLPVLAIKADVDKVTRASAVTPTVEAGRVFLPEGAAWVEPFLDEVSAFPAAVHDDYTDAFVHALTYLRQRLPGQNVIDYYAQFYERGEDGALHPRVEQPRTVAPAAPSPTAKAPEPAPSRADFERAGLLRRRW
jgi:predicted phage terminase large subunit-like protein